MNDSGRGEGSRGPLLVNHWAIAHFVVFDLEPAVQGLFVVFEKSKCCAVSALPFAVLARVWVQAFG